MLLIFLLRRTSGHSLPSRKENTDFYLLDLFSDFRNVDLHYSARAAGTDGAIDARLIDDDLSDGNRGFASGLYGIQEGTTILVPKVIFREQQRDIGLDRIDGNVLQQGASG